jgi:hypothetical protein
MQEMRKHKTSFENMDALPGASRQLEEMLRRMETLEKKTQSDINNMRKATESEINDVRKATESEINDVRKAGEKLKAEIDMLNPFRQEVHTLRRAVLDGPSKGRDENIAANRNRLAHGGHIVADLSIIDQSRGRFPRWRNSFDRLYQVDYELIRDDIAKAPSAVIDAFNMRTDVTVLLRWQAEDMTAGRAAILGLCNSIIGEWQRWLKTGRDSTQLDFEEKHRKLVDLYHSFWGKLTSP